jgi:hypothetical protein
VPRFVLIFQFVLLILFALLRKLDEALLPLHEGRPPGLLVLLKMLVLVLRGPVRARGDHRLAIRLVLYCHRRRRRFKRRGVITNFVVMMEVVRVLVREAAYRAPMRGGGRSDARLGWGRWRKDAARVG